jgi:hypothetical protein
MTLPPTARFAAHYGQSAPCSPGRASLCAPPAAAGRRSETKIIQDLT